MSAGATTVDQATMEKLLSAAAKVDRLENLLARLEKAVVTPPPATSGVHESKNHIPPKHPSTIPHNHALIENSQSQPHTHDPIVPKPNSASSNSPNDREASLLHRIAQLESQNRLLQEAVLTKHHTSNEEHRPTVNGLHETLATSPSCDGQTHPSLYAKRSTRSASIEIQVFEAHMAKGNAEAQSQLQAARSEYAANLNAESSSTQSPKAGLSIATTAPTLPPVSQQSTLTPPPSVTAINLSNSPVWTFKQQNINAPPPPPFDLLDSNQSNSAESSLAPSVAHSRIPSASTGVPALPTSLAASTSSSTGVLPAPQKASFRLLRADSRQCEYSHVGNGRISLGVRSTNLVRLNWAPKDSLTEKQPTNVLIIKKPGDLDVARALYDVALWLHAHSKTVWVEPSVRTEELASLSSLPFLHSWSSPSQLNSLHLYIDLVICLGGDGTLLWASNLFKTSVPPVISFALGSLGFLSPFPIDSFPEALTKVFAGGFHLTLRSRLVCTIVKGKQSKKKTHSMDLHGAISTVDSGSLIRGLSDPSSESPSPNDQPDPASTTASHTPHIPPNISVVKARHYSLSAQGFNTIAPHYRQTLPVNVASPGPTPAESTSDPYAAAVTHLASTTTTTTSSIPHSSASTRSAHIRAHSRYGGGQSVGVDLVDDPIDPLGDIDENTAADAAANDDHPPHIRSHTLQHYDSAPSAVHPPSSLPSPLQDDMDALAADDVESYVCMNEVIIDRGLSAYLTQLHCYVDGMLFTQVQADGIIVGTPTGSTAYSLSAGGSMCHPEVPAILFTPVCPHSLSFRPLLFPDTSTLQIKVSPNSRGSNCASFDGRHRVTLNPGDSLLISMSRWPLPSICRLDGTTDWFDGVRSVLQWNSRSASQKPFKSVSKSTHPHPDHTHPSVTSHQPPTTSAAATITHLNGATVSLDPSSPIDSPHSQSAPPPLVETPAGVDIPAARLVGIEPNPGPDLEDPGPEGLSRVSSPTVFKDGLMLVYSYLTDVEWMTALKTCSYWYHTACHQPSRQMDYGFLRSKGDSSTSEISSASKLNYHITRYRGHDSIKMSDFCTQISSLPFLDSIHYQFRKDTTIDSACESLSIVWPKQLVSLHLNFNRILGLPTSFFQSIYAISSLQTLEFRGLSSDWYKSTPRESFRSFTQLTDCVLTGMPDLLKSETVESIFLPRSLTSLRVIPAPHRDHLHKLGTLPHLRRFFWPGLHQSGDIKRLFHVAPNLESCDRLDLGVNDLADLALFPHLHTIRFISPYAPPNQPIDVRSAMNALSLSHSLTSLGCAEVLTPYVSSILQYLPPNIIELKLETTADVADTVWTSLQSLRSQLKRLTLCTGVPSLEVLLAELVQFQTLEYLFIAYHGNNALTIHQMKDAFDSPLILPQLQRLILNSDVGSVSNSFTYNQNNGINTDQYRLTNQGSHNSHPPNSTPSPPLVGVELNPGPQGPTGLRCPLGHARTDDSVGHACCDDQEMAVLESSAPVSQQSDANGSFQSGITSDPDSSTGSSSSRVSSICQTLFNDGLISIFRRLSLRDLIHAIRTCRHWSQVSHKSGIPYHLMKCEFHADDKLLHVSDEYQPKYHLIQLVHVHKKKSSNDTHKSNANELMQLSTGNISILFTQLPSLMNLACQLLQSDHKVHSSFATVSSSSTLHLIWPSTLTSLTIDFGRIELPQSSPIWTALGDARNLIQLKLLQFNPFNLQPREFTHLQQLTHLTSFTFTLRDVVADLGVDWYELFTTDQLKQLREVNFCDGMCVNFNRLAPTVNRLSHMQYFHVDESDFHPTALDQLHTIMPNLRILKSNDWYLDDLPLLTQFKHLHTLGLGGGWKSDINKSSDHSLIHCALLALPQLTTLYINMYYPTICWMRVGAHDTWVRTVDAYSYLPNLSSLIIGEPSPFPVDSTSLIEEDSSLGWLANEAVLYALLFRASLTYLSIRANYDETHVQLTKQLTKLKELIHLRQFHFYQRCNYDMIRYPDLDVRGIQKISDVLLTFRYQLKSLNHYTYQVYGIGASHFEQFDRSLSEGVEGGKGSVKKKSSAPVLSSSSAVRLVGLEPTPEIVPAPRLVGIELNPGPFCPTCRKEHSGAQSASSVASYNNLVYCSARCEARDPACVKSKSSKPTLTPPSKNLTTSILIHTADMDDTDVSEYKGDELEDQPPTGSSTQSRLVRKRKSRNDLATSSTQHVSKKPNTSKSASKPANTYNLSGAGFTFENRVQGYFLVQHLLGSHYPTIPSDQLLHTLSLRLQQTYEHNTDDLAIQAEFSTTKRPLHILISIKHRVEVVQSDKAFVSSIRDFYADFLTHNGKYEELRFILVTARHDHSKIGIFLEVLEFARNKSSFKDFKSHLHKEGQTKETLFTDVVSTILKQLQDDRKVKYQDNPIMFSQEMQWRFLQSLYLYALEMDQDGTHAQEMVLVQIRQNLVSNNSSSLPMDVWRNLLNCVRNWNQGGATIDRELLLRTPVTVLLQLQPQRKALESSNLLLQKEWNMIFNSITDVDWSTVKLPNGGVLLRFQETQFSILYQEVPVTARFQEFFENTVVKSASHARMFAILRDYSPQRLVCFCVNLQHNFQPIASCELVAFNSPTRISPLLVPIPIHSNSVGSGSIILLPLHMLALRLVEFNHFHSRSNEDWNAIPDGWLQLKPSSINMQTVLRIATCEISTKSDEQLKQLIDLAIELEDVAFWKWRFSHSITHIGTLISVLSFKRRFNILVYALEKLLSLPKKFIILTPLDLDEPDADKITPFICCVVDSSLSTDAAKAALLLIKLGAQIETRLGDVRKWEGCSGASVLIRNLISGVELLSSRSRNPIPADATTSKSDQPRSIPDFLSPMEPIPEINTSVLKTSVKHLNLIMQHCHQAGCKFDDDSLQWFAYHSLKELDSESEQLVSDWFRIALGSGAKLTPDRRAQIQGKPFLRSILNEFDNASRIPRPTPAPPLVGIESNPGPCDSNDFNPQSGMVPVVISSSPSLSVRSLTTLYRDLLHSISPFIGLHEFVRTCMVNRVWYQGGRSMKPRQDELTYPGPVRLLEEDDEGAIAQLVQSPFRIHISRLHLSLPLNQNDRGLLLLHEHMNHLSMLQLTIKLLPSHLKWIFPANLHELNIQFDCWESTMLPGFNHNVYLGECLKQIGSQSTRLAKLVIQLKNEYDDVNMDSLQELRSITTLTDLTLPRNWDLNHQIDLICSMRSIRLWDSSYRWPDRDLQRLVGCDSRPPLEDIGCLDDIGEAKAELLKRVPSLTKVDASLFIPDPTLLLSTFKRLSILYLTCFLQVNPIHLSSALSSCISITDLRLTHHTLTSEDVGRFLPHLISLIQLEFRCAGLDSLQFLTRSKASLTHLRSFAIRSAIPIEEYVHLHAISPSVESLAIIHRSASSRFDALTIARWTPGSDHFSHAAWPRLKKFTLQELAPNTDAAAGDFKRNCTTVTVTPPAARLVGVELNPGPINPSLTSSPSSSETPSPAPETVSVPFSPSPVPNHSLPSSPIPTMFNDGLRLVFSYLTTHDWVAAMNTCHHWSTLGASAPSRQLFFDYRPDKPCLVLPPTRLAHHFTCTVFDLLDSAELIALLSQLTDLEAISLAVVVKSDQSVIFPSHLKTLSMALFGSHMPRLLASLRTVPLTLTSLTIDSLGQSYSFSEEFGQMLVSLQHLTQCTLTTHKSFEARLAFDFITNCKLKSLPPLLRSLNLFGGTGFIIRSLQSLPPLLSLTEFDLSSYASNVSKDRLLRLHAFAPNLTRIAPRLINYSDFSTHLPLFERLHSYRIGLFGGSLEGGSTRPGVISRTLGGCPSLTVLDMGPWLPHYIFDWHELSTHLAPQLRQLTLCVPDLLDESDWYLVQSGLKLFPQLQAIRVEELYDLTCIEKVKVFFSDSRSFPHLTYLSIGGTPNGFVYDLLKGINTHFRNERNPTTVATTTALVQTDSHADVLKLTLAESTPLYTDVLHVIYEFLTKKELVCAGLTNRKWMVAVSTLKSRRFTIRCNDLLFLHSFLLTHVTGVSFNHFMSQEEMVQLATHLPHLEELTLMVEVIVEGVADFILPPHLIHLTLALSQPDWFSKSNIVFMDEEKDEIIKTSLISLMEQLSQQASSAFTTLVLFWDSAEYSPHEHIHGECLLPLTKIPSLTSLTVPLPYDSIDDGVTKEGVLRMLQTLAIRLSLKELQLEKDWRAESLASLTSDLGEAGLPLTDIGRLWSVDEDFLGPLRKLPLLTRLHIDEVEFEDATQLLPYLPHLTFLQFRVNEYYDDCDVNLLVTALTTCKHLQSFYIRHAQLDVDHMTKFLEPMTQLRELRLMTDRLSSFAFLSHHPHLAQNLTLVDLNWDYHRSRLPVTELNHLHRLRQLRELILSDDETLTAVIEAEMATDSPHQHLDHWPSLRTVSRQ